MNTVPGAFTIKTFIRLYPGSSVAENTTHNPKIKGSNPATGAERDKNSKKLSETEVM